MQNREHFFVWREAYRRANEATHRTMLSFSRNASSQQDLDNALRLQTKASELLQQMLAAAETRTKQLHLRPFRKQENRQAG